MFKNRALIKYQNSQSVITDQIVLCIIHTICAFELMKLKGFRDYNDMPKQVESCKICLCCRPTGAWPSFLQKSYVLEKYVQKKKCRQFVLVNKNGFNFAVQLLLLYSTVQFEHMYPAVKVKVESQEIGGFPSSQGG